MIVSAGIAAATCETSGSSAAYATYSGASPIAMTAMATTATSRTGHGPRLRATPIPVVGVGTLAGIGLRAGSISDMVGNHSACMASARIPHEVHNARAAVRYWEFFALRLCEGL